ncbi:VOC family protein [Chitinophaga sp. 30R24]|uniref:VOC family protein n=1 Tax=Chitinophaga sp. 30R24 TaxID=3248838 RepID=UPI003B90C187
MSTKLTTYLFFDGNCREAMSFYHEILGGNLQIMAMRDSPMKDQVPADAQDRVMHAYLQTPGFALMASDGMQGQPPVNGNAVELALEAESDAETEKLFSSLSAGGKVKMPLQETFWAHQYGRLTDKYGINWMISFNKPM